MIASIASVLTTLTSQYLLTSHETMPVSSPSIPLSASSQQSVLDCGSKVYSPVQKTCVARDVFDAEMQRLFVALGIDTSAYGLGGDNNK